MTRQRLMLLPDKSFTKLSVFTLLLVFTFLTNVEVFAQQVYYEIDTVTISPHYRTKSLMIKPSMEPVSLLPAISLINVKDIRKMGAVTVIDALNQVPGGLIETRGRQVKQFFSVRGQKYPYPDYAIDGVWQKEFEELPCFFSALNIEEIEIVRSSAALLTGLSALSGLINIKTREYKTPETTIEMEFGSFNTLHSHISTGNKTGSFGYAIGAGYNRTDGPENKHARESMTDLYSQINWQITKKIDLKANLFYLGGSRQMAMAEPPADKKYLDMKQTFDPYRAIISNIKLFIRPSSALSTEIQVYYSGRNPVFIDEVKNTSSNEKDFEYGVSFLHAISLSKTNVLRFGGLFNHWIAPDGKRFYIGKRCDTETFSAVITDEQQIGPVTLDAGLRVSGTYLNEYGAFNIEGDGSMFKSVTPITNKWEPAIIQGSFGASYRITGKLQAYLNSAAGQVKPRAGTLTEDYATPLNETRLKLDFGMIRNLVNSGKITLTLFSVYQKNAIALSGTTYLDPENNIIRELYINRDQNHHGVEFETVFPVLFKYFKPFLNFTYMRSKMEDDGTIITNKENPVLISGGGVYSNWKNLDLNLLYKYISPFENERFAAIGDGPQPLGDFLVADLNAGYTTRGNVNARFYIRIKNITDKKYSTVTGYPDFGRMIFAGIQFKILKNS